MNMVMQISGRLLHDISKPCRKYVNATRTSIILVLVVKIKIYRTTVLPVVLCGCETWSLTLKEERGLSVFKNTVLRIIFGPRRDKVTMRMEKTT